jgi:hypothetical protein
MFADKSGPLISAPNSPIADVPVPAGFTMTSDSTSRVVPGSALRYVDHRYKGSDDVLPVVKFYRDHLPERGWNWVDQNQSKGNEVTLHYAKGKEDCVITVSPRGFPTWGTLIRVKIDPTEAK